jgi:hypothetical protein
MTLRGFSAAGAETEADTRRIGGEIFSKVKTGMVNPSTLVTKRPWNWPRHFPGRISSESFRDDVSHETFKPV